MTVHDSGRQINVLKSEHRKPHQRIGRIIALVLLTGVLTSCANITPYERTLPDWVERVYLPMVNNQTFEPGLEELITNAFISEIMADGRLEIVKKNNSDLIIQITLTNYSEQTDNFESDDIERKRLITITSTMELFNPDDLENPVARLENIVTSLTYRSDYRSTYVVLDVDALQLLAERASRDLLLAIMSQIEFEEI